MKKLILSLAICLGCLCAHSQGIAPAIPVDPVIEARIDSTLKRLTLEEKVGQMCQITVDVITDFPASKEEFHWSEAMLDTVIGKCKVGSLLNVPLSVAQTKETWARLITRIQEKSLQEIGIPCLYGVDQIHGTTYTLGGTLFPQSINIAASFNRDLARESAATSAYETRAGLIPWTFAPLWTWGETPAGLVCGKALGRTAS